MKGGALKYLFKPDVVVKGIKVSYSESLELDKYPNGFWVPIYTDRVGDTKHFFKYYDKSINDYVKINNKDIVKKIYEKSGEGVLKTLSTMDGTSNFIYAYRGGGFNVTTINDCDRIVSDRPFSSEADKCYNSGIWERPSQNQYNKHAENEQKWLEYIRSIAEKEAKIPRLRYTPQIYNQQTPTLLGKGRVRCGKRKGSKTHRRKVNKRKLTKRRR